MRVAVSRRLVFPGTLPRIVSTTERNQVGIASRSNALGAPRRKGNYLVGLDARSTEGSKREFRALYGCNNLTASSTNDEAFWQPSVWELLAT